MGMSVVDIPGRDGAAPAGTIKGLSRGGQNLRVMPMRLLFTGYH